MVFSVIMEILCVGRLIYTFDLISQMSGRTFSFSALHHSSVIIKTQRNIFHIFLANEQ